MSRAARKARILSGKRATVWNLQSPLKKLKTNDDDYDAADDDDDYDFDNFHRDHDFHCNHCERTKHWHWSGRVVCHGQICIRKQYTKSTFAASRRNYNIKINSDGDGDGDGLTCMILFFFERANTIHLFPPPRPSYHQPHLQCLTILPPRLTESMKTLRIFNSAWCPKGMFEEACLLVSNFCLNSI